MLEPGPSGLELDDPCIDLCQACGHGASDVLAGGCTAVAGVEDLTDLAKGEAGGLGLTDETQPAGGIGV